MYGPGPFIEGGDVFLLGHGIYVGHSGNATNLAGIQWLQQYLGKPYRVHKVPLSKKMLHLDCCPATLRPGLAIVCREGFKHGLPKFLRGWKLIDVSLEDAHTKMATNGLVIDRKTIMIASGLDDLAKALRAAGQTVIETPFDDIYFYGGSFRCWHHPLIGPVDPVTKMNHRLKTIAGKAIYAKRKSTVEPVFGIIKAVMGFRQFLLRGLD